MLRFDRGRARRTIVGVRPTERSEAVAVALRSPVGPASEGMNRPGSGSSRLRIVGPRLSDPRLHVAAVVVTVQVLGQTSFGFRVSIAQLAIALLTCAVIDVTIGVLRDRVLAWPASALLAGNGIALVLRVPGTRPGNWWSLRGWWIYAAAGVVAMASKHLVRVGARPWFNPSNLALVATFLVLGPARVEPLDFWWGPWGPALVAVVALVVGGGVLIGSRLRMLGAIGAFAATFAAGVAILAAAGHCMTARWHIGPVCGAAYWTALVTSPEVLIFACFMVTDPRSAPRGRGGACGSSPEAIRSVQSANIRSARSRPNAFSTALICPPA